jgi:hypothetical protein
MDNLIEYIPQKPSYNILIEMITKLPLTIAILFFGLMYLFGRLIFICSFDLHYTIKTDIKNVKEITKLISMILFSLLVVITMITSIPIIDKKINDYRTKYDTKTVALSNIKDNIIVENNKVKIKPLEQNYKYKDDKFDKTKEQTFKIEYDEFYNKYFLTDQYFTRHEISKEEYEMLKNK